MRKLSEAYADLICSYSNKETHSDLLPTWRAENICSQAHPLPVLAVLREIFI